MHSADSPRSIPNSSLPTTPATARPPVGEFVRFKIGPTAETTKMDPPTIISGVAGEMARCHDRHTTKPYNHAFGSGGPTPQDFGAVLHIDIAAGTSKL
ncbi:hypothetical protein CcaCcLH18_03786 [Colletotrichum camelliae]|nr:hypothetical protein CcaCcLH18_03786 [Colletotrichum camelliae]